MLSEKKKGLSERKSAPFWFLQGTTACEQIHVV